MFHIKNGHTDLEGQDEKNELFNFGRQNISLNSEMLKFLIKLRPADMQFNLKPNATLMRCLASVNIRPCSWPITHRISSVLQSLIWTKKRQEGMIQAFQSTESKCVAQRV